MGQATHSMGYLSKPGSYGKQPVVRGTQTMEHASPPMDQVRPSIPHLRQPMVRGTQLLGRVALPMEQFTQAMRWMSHPMGLLW